MTLTIRKLDERIAVGLSDLANKKGMSREALVRIILADAVESEGIKETERIYQNLFDRFEELVKQNNAIIEKNTIVIDVLQHLE